MDAVRLIGLVDRDFRKTWTRERSRFDLSQRIKARLASQPDPEPESVIIFIPADQRDEFDGVRYLLVWLRLGNL